MRASYWLSRFCCFFVCLTPVVHRDQALEDFFLSRETQLVYL